MTLRTEIVVTPARWAEIGPAWDALWRRGGRSVFQSHGWIGAWWTRPPSDASHPHIALCWEDNQLAAAMPLATRRHRGVRVLEWAAKDCSDYCDALAVPEFSWRWTALRRTWGAVTAAGGFDLVYLSHVHPKAVFRTLLEGRQQPVRLKPGQRAARSLQVWSNGANGQVWLRRLGEEAERHARRLRTLGEMGPVETKLWGPGDATLVLLERMIALKQRWLADTGQRSAIMENDAAIFRALVRELVRQESLRLFTVHCGDQLAAALLNIAADRSEQVFFSVHDSRFDRAEPEALVLTECLVSAFDRGLIEVDLLCVEEESRYGFASNRLDLASFVGARTLAGRLALAVGERLDRKRVAA